MFDAYLPVVVTVLLATFIGLLIIVLSSILSRHDASDVKLMPYECGMDPIGSARKRFSVKFFLVGMLFIIFDIELIFLFPWAVMYQKLGVFGFIEMLVFVVVLLLGLAYVWIKGALEWE